MNRVLAFYLPQFHPIPENDTWWGKGFTEWRNVAQSKPRFRGHYQPHIPGDLGFYDLRQAETRYEQADLARRYGISAFCYYHYWFGDRRLLSRPIDEVLESGEPDFPFCMCWANESWTRAWDGRNRDVLIHEEYSGHSHEKHIEWLLKVFSDRRYIKVEGKPFFAIYRPADIPELHKVLDGWRTAASKAGFPGLYLVGMRTGFVRNVSDGIEPGLFDAYLDFQPNREDFPAPRSVKTSLLESTRTMLPGFIYQYLKTRGSATKIIDYGDLVNSLIRRGMPFEERTFPCVFPSWDNTARRRTPTVIQNLSPGAYEQWLRNALSHVKEYPPEERFVFINAWNEWAEGCHLEPDLRLGRGFLDATARAVKAANRSDGNHAQSAG